MNGIGNIRFWQLMVGTGFGLLLIGLVMIFLPPGVGDSGPFLIEFYQASIEASEMGLALIVLGLSCFLIGRKDLADLRAYQDIQQDLGKAGSLAARLVAERVDQAFKGLSSEPTSLASRPDLDVSGTREDLRTIRAGQGPVSSTTQIILQAERGIELLDALEREGYLI